MKRSFFLKKIFRVDKFFRSTSGFLTVCLLLVVAVGLGLSENQPNGPEFVSVELDTARLSPEGPEGGYGIHASACFAGETKIATPNGGVSIEDLQIGDEIYSWADGEKIVTHVAELVVHDGFAYPTNDFERFPLLEVTFTDGSVVQVTANHPIYSDTKGGWLAAELFEIGDVVSVLDGKRQIASIIRTAQKPTVYNLETDHPSQTYFADGVLAHTGRGVLMGMIEGFLVATPNGDIPIEDIRVGDEIYSYANGETIITKVAQTIREKPTGSDHNEAYELQLSDGTSLTLTANQTVYVVGGGFVEVHNVDIGETVRTQDGTVRNIVAIAQSESGGTVYNIETDHESHNYFANGLLVHNYSEASYYKQGSYYGQSTYYAQSAYVVPEPDLVSENLRLAPGVVAEINTPITLEADVSNVGDADAGGPFVAAYYWRFNDTDPWYYFQQAVSSTTYPDMVVGGSDVHSFGTFTVSSPTTLLLAHCVDDYGTITESDDTNNCSYTALTLVDPDAPLVTECTVSPNPAIATVDTVTWTATTTGGTAPFTYQWSGLDVVPPPPPSNSNTLDWVYYTSGQKDMWVRVTDSLGHTNGFIDCSTVGVAGPPPDDPPLDVQDPPAPTVDLQVCTIPEGGVCAGSYTDGPVTLDHFDPNNNGVSLYWDTPDGDRCTGDSYYSTGGATTGTVSSPSVVEPVTGTRTYTVTCYNDTYNTQASDSVVVNVAGGNPDISLQNEGRVRQGDTKDIDWDTGGHPNCVIDGTNGQQVIPGAQTGTFTTDPIFAETVYTISCDTGNPDSVTVRVLPIFEEI